MIVDQDIVRRIKVAGIPPSFHSPADPIWHFLILQSSRSIDDATRGRRSIMVSVSFSNLHSLLI